MSTLAALLNNILHAKPVTSSQEVLNTIHRIMRSEPDLTLIYIGIILIHSVIDIYCNIKSSHDFYPLKKSKQFNKKKKKPSHSVFPQKEGGIKSSAT